MIGAVIFDLDGTLIHLPVDYERFFRELRKVMKTPNVRPLTKVIARSNAETRKKALEVWKKAEFAALPKMRVNNEGMNLYRRFSEKTKVLVTLQSRALALSALERLELSFRVVITREDSLDRVMQLELAVHELGLRSEDVLFIGDTENDSISAEKVGCKFIKVRT